MGEVYQAYDGKLGRDVAIKILPGEFARNPERLARLRREARTLASLNHPNIAAIYGLEESGDVDYLVMELVSGETLQERRPREGPLPLKEHHNSAACLFPISQALWSQPELKSGHHPSGRDVIAFSWALCGNEPAFLDGIERST